MRKKHFVLLDGGCCLVSSGSALRSGMVVLSGSDDGAV